MIALLASLLLPLSGTAGTTPVKPVPSPVVPPVRINVIGGSRFGSGDRVRVQVETADDGYLVVLRVDTDGHIRVLFPIDPDLDPFVRGGKNYELRGRADRETFLADEHGGTGVIYAAVSREPMKFRDFSVGDHWDYDALRLQDSASDPESELSRFVARMTDNGHFDYDIVNYSVTGPYIASAGDAYAPVYNSYGDQFDPYMNCLGCRWGYRPSGFGISLGFGSGYYDPWGYNNYDPYYSPYYSDPFYYGSYGYSGYGYRGSNWRYPGQGRPITVINLPRPQIPSTAYGYRSRPRAPLPPLGSIGIPSRAGEAGTAGVGNRNGRDPVLPSPGTRVGDRSREPVVRTPPPPRTADPGRGSSQAPPAQRTPPASAGSSGQGTTGSTGTRSRPRGGGGGNDFQAATVTNPGQRAPIDRVSEAARPVFREPPRPVNQAPVPTSPRSASREPAPRPVYREPPRVERMSPPPRAERVSPPPRVVHSSPPPAPKPPPASSGGSRARPRTGGGR